MKKTERDRKLNAISGPLSRRTLDLMRVIVDADAAHDRKHRIDYGEISENKGEGVA
jgi:hypothetical protein